MTASMFRCSRQRHGPRKEGGIELCDARSSTEAFYQTFNCERPESVECDSESGALSGTTKADREIVGVILSGKTEAHLHAAWGNYEFMGRVRISDGLVVLVRQPVRHRHAINSCHANL
ncbi:hypothetical protein BJV78DRAFT_590373 [Lactifluus subvellereus]|nr:hypothetical protein BJV78DRAFT_590373 [Lactifluus subvellereus]